MSERVGRGAAWTDERGTSERVRRGAARTDERGTSERVRRGEVGMGRRAGPRTRAGYPA